MLEFYSFLTVAGSSVLFENIATLSVFTVGLVMCYALFRLSSAGVRLERLRKDQEASVQVPVTEGAGLDEFAEFSKEFGVNYASKLEASVSFHLRLFYVSGLAFSVVCLLRAYARSSDGVLTFGDVTIGFLLIVNVLLLMVMLYRSGLSAIRQASVVMIALAIQMFILIGLTDFEKGDLAYGSGVLTCCLSSQ